jgi:CRP-like cAMP-binding protein
MNKYMATSIEAILVIGFISFIPALFFIDNAPAIIWTMIIPLLPLGIILIGFSRWRNFCPLAFFSKISQKLQWIPKRKVPAWFENNLYYFQYGLLFTALALRLIILNYHTEFLGLFFLFTILAAFFINLIYTGKSWCNFFCPVGVVERIYCLSNAKNYMTNSACVTCTTCKRDCPDIDMESNYWKEVQNKQKTFVFYSFPGLILGFYLYFYLQSGSFEYYYTGEWTHQDLSIFSQGFFFAKEAPLFIAAPLTLAIFSFGSYFLFKGIENYIWKKQFFPDLDILTLSHRMKVVTSFIAFNTFYAFAGAPSYMQYPMAYSALYFVVVFASSALLYKEFFREEAYYIQERFALKIKKRWDSLKPIPKNLTEIYYTYVNENKGKHQRLQAYKESVRDLMQEGILTQDSMLILEKVREQIGITHKEHAEVMRRLKLKHEHLFDNSIEKTSESRYQRNSYAKMIQEALHNRKALSINYLSRLQKQFQISDETHQMIMQSILDTDNKIKQDILSILENLGGLIKIEKSIFNDNRKTTKFLLFAVQDEFATTLKDLFNLLYTLYNDNRDTLKILQDMSKGKPVDPNFTLNKESLSFMDEAIADNILELKAKVDTPCMIMSPDNNLEVVRSLLNHDAINIAIAALLNVQKYDRENFEDINFDRFILSSDQDICELALKILSEPKRITMFERMMYLHNVEIFANIRFYELSVLAKTTKIKSYKPNEYIIHQGGVGNALYVILQGEVDVEVDGQKTAELSKDNYFGEISILGDIRHTASVKTTQDTLTLTLSKTKFKQFILENPKVNTKLMKEVINKFMNIQATKDYS